MELLFKLQKIPDDLKIEYAAFPLIETAHLWFIRSTKDEPMADWEHFNHSICKYFGPPIRHDTIGELAPLKQTGTVDDHTNNSDDDSEQATQREEGTPKRKVGCDPPLPPTMAVHTHYVPPPTMPPPQIANVSMAHPQLDIVAQPSPSSAPPAICQN